MMDALLDQLKVSVRQQRLAQSMDALKICVNYRHVENNQPGGVPIMAFRHPRYLPVHLAEALSPSKLKDNSTSSHGISP